jgi:hypothetical protein
MRYEERSPVMVLLLTLITCGLYLIYWYYVFYRDLSSITGRTPTGLPFFLDCIIALFTFGLWGVYVDYCISQQLQQIRMANGIDLPDSTLLVLVLDAVSIFTAHLLFIFTSAIQQDEWNKMIRAKGGQPFYRPASAMAAAMTVEHEQRRMKERKDSSDDPYGG